MYNNKIFQDKTISTWLNSFDCYHDFLFLFFLAFFVYFYLIVNHFSFKDSYTSLFKFDLHES